jgi:hypothetical protein
MSSKMADQFLIGHFVISKDTRTPVILRQQPKNLVSNGPAIPSGNETFRFAQGDSVARTTSWHRS